MSESISAQINLALAVFGGLVVIYALFSRFFKERLLISDPILAVLVGILLSPLVLNWFAPSNWGNQEIILLEAARVAIAIQLMSTALRLPSGYPFRHWRGLGVLLGLIMPLMWLCSSLLAYLILDLSVWEALLLGAVITPTDPVLAATIVTGAFAEQNLAKQIRHLLSAESGANDGLGYPFVLLPILMLNRPQGEAISHWLLEVWLWEVGAAIVMGGLLGYLAGVCLVWAQEKEIIDKQSFFTYTLALSVGVLGIVKLLGSDGILAVFVAGIAFDLKVESRDRIEEEKVQDSLDLLLTTSIFVLFALALPWQEWLDLGWKGLLLAVAVLLLRRLPGMLLLYSLMGLRRRADALFMGWFGPIGVAAIFYANLAVRDTGIEEIWAIASLIIFTSVFAHGITAVPFTKLHHQPKSDN
ncbi:MAG: sodium:proton antiporter [Kamptonema sp. SIO1D9]|nr:sodium:proton antiporter [Kamptonema sp. SIO1D9]